MLDLPAQSKYCPLLPYAEIHDPGWAYGLPYDGLGKVLPSGCCYQEVHVEMMLKGLVKHTGLAMGHDGQSIEKV